MRDHVFANFRLTRSCLTLDNDDFLPPFSILTAILTFLIIEDHDRILIQGDHVHRLWPYGTTPRRMKSSVTS